MPGSETVLFVCSKMIIVLVFFLAFISRVCYYSLQGIQLSSIGEHQKTYVFLTQTQTIRWWIMDENIKYYVVKQKALPEVLLKVAQANRLIETKGISVADATEQVGISRSSYYKYKEDIFPFRDNVKGKTITFVLSMDDEPGLLSLVLKKLQNFTQIF